MGSFLLASLFVGVAAAVLVGRAVADPFSRDEPAEPQPLALRPRDAAKALGVCERTLSTWEKAGIIRAVRIGGGKKQTVLYPVDVLRAWLAERAGTQQPAK